MQLVGLRLTKGLFGKSDLIEVEPIQPYLFEIELFRLVPFACTLFWYISAN